MSGERAAAGAGGAAGFLAPAAAALFGGRAPFRIRAWDGSEAGPEGAPVLVVRHPDALRRIAARPGELGAARAYVAGELDADGDLLEALRRVFAAVERSPARPPGPAGLARVLRAALVLGAAGRPPAPPPGEARRRVRLRRGERDRAAIAHHYDVSADFYRLLLDPSMAYSCAYWTSEEPGYTLADAQRDKLDLVCRKLGLDRAGDPELLDLGCGWGSLALHAAERYGARVTAVTLSAEQAAFVRARAAERGLGGRVEAVHGHWRDAPGGGHRAIASIEMGEHVGRGRYRAFAARLAALAAPGGRVLVQQMSRRGARPGGGPFIESYIAPGMHMRPVGATVSDLEGAGLEVRGVQALREHYVRTARVWLDALEAREAEAEALIGAEGVRVWRLYLAGGSLAFEQGRMGVDQVLAVRPGGGAGGGRR
ncbi:class I SAM-dependent methyltransferase [Nocardiopsis sp. CNT-189]|uniref:class I SAM-dependent methyltransferase n=1 Tax=Nocardiopsis oceanisediminis TaxID=2816862 RepID=UPI003B3015DD